MSDKAVRIHKARQNEERLAAKDYQDDGLVFCHKDGRALHPNVVSRTFVRQVKRAGLPTIRLHDVRHSYIVAAIRAGVPVKVISERVGHASTAFTMDIYASVLPGMGADAAAKVAAAIDGGA